jgi:hypothetical protein
LFDERLKADYEPDLIDPETAAEAVRRARHARGPSLAQRSGRQNSLIPRDSCV